MKAHSFDLPGVDGKRHSPASARGENGLVVMFICNHCPYVKKSIDRIVSDCRELKSRGIGAIAVMSNDPAYNAEDSFDNMKRVARDKGFPFPYVLDEAQDVARAYDAVCTPDFFGFDANLELRYHGRLEELAEAMTGKPPPKPINSIGCSIKWKKAT
jgi:peroxiredoxin